MISIASPSPPAPEGLEPLAEQVMASLKDYEQRLGLTQWWITVTWGPCDAVMSTFCEPEYYEADITVDLTKLPAQYVDEYARHELFHVLVWMYTSVAEGLATVREKAILRKLEERMVSDLEQMPIWENLKEE